MTEGALAPGDIVVCGGKTALVWSTETRNDGTGQKRDLWRTGQ